MTVITQRQPYFIADTEAERITSRPDNSLVFCKDTQLAYILTTGVFIGIHDNNASKYYYNGVLKPNAKTIMVSAVVTAGVATFNLKDASNNAIFTNIYQTQPMIYNATIFPAYGTLTVAGDKKTATMTVNKLASTNAIVVLVSVLTGLTTTAANGETVYLLIIGD